MPEFDFPASYTRSEFTPLITVVQKWRLYLLGHSFIVRTDHKALKFLLDQQVGIVDQQRWLSKLLGYDFVIEFKKGSANSMVDALSRQSEDTSSQGELSIALISFPTLTWVSNLKQSYLMDSLTAELL
jgi:hypothetical protein